MTNDLIPLAALILAAVALLTLIILAVNERTDRRDRDRDREVRPRMARVQRPAGSVRPDSTVALMANAHNGFPPPPEHRTNELLELRGQVRELRHHIDLLRSQKDGLMRANWVQGRRLELMTAERDNALDQVVRLNQELDWVRRTAPAARSTTATRSIRPQLGAGPANPGPVDLDGAEFDPSYYDIDDLFASLKFRPAAA